MTKVKLERINSQMIKELSEIIYLDIKDEMLKKATITAAKITPDFSSAKIYYTYLGDYDREEFQKEITNAAPFLRHKLSERMDLRHTPELHFTYDQSIEYGANIEKILSEINKN